MGNKEQWKALSYGRTKLSDAYCKNAWKQECAYLKKLEPDRLLCGFRETAGRKGKAQRYPGWEVTEIQGHTLGHYLSALAQAYAYSRDAEFKRRVDDICQELKECQQTDGYLFASPVDLFDRVENHQPAWVPWYTMHKIFEGLLLAYELADNQTALFVAKRLGDWVVARTAGWTEEIQRQVLSVEYGGMNDCLYELYRATGEARYARAAHKFDEEPLFDRMRAHEDVLNGLHANTTIPKILGALNRYESLAGMEDYLRIAENFWEIVTEHHTYVTGGNSEWEHFGRPDILDMERTACNCETCNTYNMLKLSDRLFRLTGKKRYADFYERTWLNAILSSQNPQSGMTTYFQPMATGFFKVYSTPFDKFWCCTGTGMENFTKLCEGIYYEKDGALAVNRYVSSELDWCEEHAKVTVEAGFPDDDTVCITLTGTPSAHAKLMLRIPEWTAGEPQAELDGQPYAAQKEQGYLVLDAVAGQFTVRFPMEVACHTLPDNPNAVAFTYGPAVLSAKMGTQQMETTVTGVDVTVPKKDFYIKDYLVLKKTPQEWKAGIGSHLVKKDTETAFVLRGTDEDGRLVFVPHYRQHKERYGIYFHLYQEGSEELCKERRRLEKADSLNSQAGDIIPIGNDQYELAHKVRGEKTETAIEAGRRCRFIEEGGYLSFEMQAASGQMLYVRYQKTEPDTKAHVLVNGVPVEGCACAAEDEEGFHTFSYKLPADITGAEPVTVCFCNKEGQKISRIFDEVYIK